MPELLDKAELFKFVHGLLASRLEAARAAMMAAQASANEESKSSMGDKYETGRAMAQIDRDMYARQYDQNLQEMAVLDRINAASLTGGSGLVSLGSLVYTSLGWLYLAASLGTILFKDIPVMVVSAKSPIGRLVLGKQAGAIFVFQGKTHRLEQVL